MFKRLQKLVASAVPGTSGVSPLLRNDPSAAPARGTSGVSPLLRNDPSAEQRAAVLAGQHITYTLKRSGKRRSIGLRINDKGLTVSMPLNASESWLHEVLQLRAAWVVEKLDGWQARKPPAQEWTDGEFIPYLGEQLTLRVIASTSAAVTRQRHDELQVSFRGEIIPLRIERAVSLWYQEQALKLFAARVAHYAPRLGVAPQQVKLSAARTRWGSCTARGTLRLNVQLIKLPLYLIDYVVVHELAHLREMNHSAAFWRVVASACPDYLKLRRELKGIAL